MLKSVLALCAFVFIVEGSGSGLATVMKKGLGKKNAVSVRTVTQGREAGMRNGKMSPATNPYPGEIEFQNINVFAWNVDESSPFATWQRTGHVFNLRFQDTIWIVYPDKESGAFSAPATTTSIELKNGEFTLAKAKEYATALEKGARIYVSNKRWKGGNEIKPKEGWAAAGMKEPKGWEKEPKGMSQQKGWGFILVRADTNLLQFKSTADAQSKGGFKAPAEVKIAQARYADDGDYYGYAGEYYGEDYDDEFENIDASRLIEYAYNMGLRAGSRKANQRKRRYDYYYR